MKIFSAEQIYQADKFTIEKQQITSDALMERAALQLFHWIHDKMEGAPITIHLFCGIGNNGGDGLALSRHLHGHGYQIKAYVVNYSEKRSKDFLLNLNRLKERKVWPEFLDGKSGLPEIGESDLIVDAIFGIGLNRNPDMWVVELIKHLNATRAFMLSVDVPSGLFMDKISENDDAVIQANVTLSFQAPKLIFFLPQTGNFTEHWEILDIGLDAEYLIQTESEFYLVDKPLVKSFYRPRQKFTHKGTYGHAAIIGGSYGKIGAVHLTAKACLTTGAGLVTSYVPKCGYTPLQTGLPETMVATDANEHEVSRIDLPLKPDVAGIGMGMGTSENAIKAFSAFLDTVDFPLVIDADGLNILFKKKELLEKLPKQAVLTPHPKELERLIGPWKDDFDKLKKVKSFSKEYDCVVVVKGAHTITVYKDKGFVNTTGNPGMATAGSGDVLTGMITSLLAQGYAPLQASIFGTFLHGLAGDIAVSGNSYEALTAQRIISFVGKAYVELFRNDQPGTEEK
ncbi:NAD(P)H-hydrate dehydratase [Allomuricauda sp. d1]|uniref:NAD(P)H-hydrate dehydratase n=1 Tax=Allomuricauda sp. d1 TaxID=3136725 RepID=UPI0031CF972E